MGDLRTTAPIFQWADNLLMFCRSSREAIDLLSQLERCLGEHSLRGIPAGPLTLGRKSISRIRDGFDFIGVNYTIQRERIVLRLTDEATSRFMDRLEDRIEDDRAVKDGGYNSAMDYVFHQWPSQAVTEDVAEMQSRALSLITDAAERDGHET